MNPEGGTILSLSSARLMMTVVPKLGEAYAQSTIGLINFMMTLVAQEYERGADIRVAENAEIRALFAELAPLVNDAALRAKLEEAARAKDDSLRISVLNAANYELRRLLTRLLAHIEEQKGEHARAAEKRVWRLFRTMADRRVVSLMPS